MTARRRDERLLDVPVSVQAIAGDKLSMYQVSSVSDLSTQIPSLVAGKASSGAAVSIFLRGVGSSASNAGFDQSVSFVIDGLAMSRGREIALPQFDIQRVEVLEGPQALYFGKNTTGGLISITSNSPTNKFEAGVRGGYEFNARQRYVEGYVSGPLSDTLKVRLAGRYSKSDGALTNTAFPTSNPIANAGPVFRPSDRRGRAEILGLRGTVLWEPSSNLKFELKGGYSSDQDGGGSDNYERLCGGGRTTPYPGNGKPASPNADCVVNGRNDLVGIPVAVATSNFDNARDGRLYGDFKSDYVVLNSTLTSDPFDVTSITGYYHYRNVQLNNVSGEAIPAAFTELNEFKQFSEELRFQSKFEGPFNVMFGAYYAHGDLIYNNNSYIFDVPKDPVTGTYVTFKRYSGFQSNSLSAFLQGTLDFGTGFQLSGGARYSIEERNSYSTAGAGNSLLAANFFPAGTGLTDRYRDSNLSPEATLRYKPSSDLMFYAAYKQGFKTGGFNISQVLNLTATAAKARFRSEKAHGEEIGAKMQLFSRTLSLNVTAYNYIYTDLQVQFLDPISISLISGNVGKLITRGVEGDFNWRTPADNFSIRGALAYNDAKYQDYIGQCYPGQTLAQGCNLSGPNPGQVYSGRTAPKAPHLTGRIGFAYEQPVTNSGMKLVLNSDLTYTSKYNYSDSLEPFAIQKAFAKWDASLSLVSGDGRWTFSVIGRNLTNKLAVINSNQMPFTGGTGTGTAAGIPSDLDVYVENPREVFVEAKFKF